MYSVFNIQRRNMLWYIINLPNTTRSFERLSMREKPSSHHMTVRNNTHVHHIVNICITANIQIYSIINIEIYMIYVHVYIVRLLDPLGIWRKSVIRYEFNKLPNQRHRVKQHVGVWVTLKTCFSFKYIVWPIKRLISYYYKL